MTPDSVVIDLAVNALKILMAGGVSLLGFALLKEITR